MLALRVKGGVDVRFRRVTAKEKERDKEAGKQRGKEKRLGLQVLCGPVIIPAREEYDRRDRRNGDEAAVRTSHLDCAG